jgi:sulfate adenylyltransferase subunit 1 (EFTu-like GTPase family)
MAEENKENEIRIKKNPSGQVESVELSLHPDTSKGSVTVDNSDLEAENEELKATLSFIAEKTLNEKCEKYHIDRNAHTTEEAISLVKAMEEQEKYSESCHAPLNDVQLSESGKPQIIESNEGYNSVEEMISDLQVKAKSNNEAESAFAKECLRQMTFKLLQSKERNKPLDVEIAIPKKQYEANRNERKRKLQKEKES